jgi:hypothetical protein
LKKKKILIYEIQPLLHGESMLDGVLQDLLQFPFFAMSDKE